MREAAAGDLRNVIPRAEDSCSLALGTGGDTRDGGDTCWTARHVCRVLGWAGLAAAYNAYLGYALHLHRATGRDLDWCGGLGFLLLVTLLAYTGLRAANGTFFSARKRAFSLLYNRPTEHYDLYSLWTRGLLRALKNFATPS